MRGNGRDTRGGPSRPNKRSTKKTMDQANISSESAQTAQRKGKKKAALLDAKDTVSPETTAPMYERHKVVSSTPTGSPEVQYLYLEPPREAIIEYLGGEVWLGSLEYFFEHVLPPIRRVFDIDRILKRCVRNKTLQRDARTKRYSWACLSHGRERGRTYGTDIYNALKNVFDAVTDVALKCAKDPKLNSTCYLYSDGSNALWPTMDGGIKADAHIFLKDPNHTYPEEYKGRHWYNSAFSIHSRKSVVEDYQNVEYVLQSLRHPMVIDPCRRFTLGATVEETRIRLWLYSRGMIVCSEEFDFNSEPGIMVKLILSLIFADKVALGWDPTVDAEYDGDQHFFRFKIDGKTYKTSSKNTISDSKADGIYTSATRIFKAFHIDDKDEKEPVVIKDFWSGEKYETEDAIRKMILSDISETTEREILKHLTLTPIASGRVKVGDEEDHTEATILRGKSPTKKYRIALPNKKVMSGSSCLTEGPEGSIEEGNEDLELAQIREEKRKKAYYHRWHYRIVFKEYAVPYDQLHNLDDMFLVLVCAVKALLVIHKAGWVHRDLSPGNLYLYTDPVSGEKRGLVGDLEFAKKVGTGNKRDGRTGTPNFMAVEIIIQRYHLKPMETKRGPRITTKVTTSILNDFFDEVFASVEQADKPTTTGEYERGIWANYLHDLESIWWIAVWTLFSFQDLSQAESTSAEAVNMRKSQGRIWKLLFPGCLDYKCRMPFFYGNIEFENNIIHASNHLKGLKTLIILIRSMLLWHYEEEERKEIDPILLTDGGSLHRSILEVFNKVPRHAIKVENIQKKRKERKNYLHPKRITHVTKSDDRRPAKRQRFEESSEDTRSSPIVPISTSRPEPELRESAEGMRLRSGLRIGRNKLNNRTRERRRIAVNGPDRTARENEPLSDGNRRMTRSMTKKKSNAEMTNARNDNKDGKPPTKKPRRRR